MATAHFFHPRRFVLSILLLALIITILPDLLFAETPQQVLDLQQTAAQCAAKKDYSGAVEKYQQIISTYPGTFYAMEAQTEIIVSYVKTKAMVDAENAIQRLLSDYSNQSEIGNFIRKIGSAYDDIGQFDKTKQLCQLALTNWPSHPEAVLSQRDLVIAHIKLGELAEADTQVESIKNSSYPSSDKAGALYEIAKQWGEKEQTERAIELHIYNSKTFQDAQKGMWSQVEIIKSAFQENKFSTAQSEINILLQRFSDQQTLPKEIYQIGQLYEKADRPEQAMALYQYNVSHSSSKEYALKSRIALFQLEALQDKNNVWIQSELDSIKANFSDQTALPKELWAAGETCRKNVHGNLGLQIDLYNAEHFAGTQYGMLSHTEAIYYQLSKDLHEDAESSCRVFVERYGQDSGFMKQAGNIVGQYDKRGILDKAEFLCRSAVQLQPNHKDAIVFQKHLIGILLDRNDFSNAEAALQEFTSAYQSHPGYFRRAYELGWDFQQHQRHTTALNIYDQLQAQFPEHREIGRIAYYKARAYSELDQIEKSMEYVDEAFAKHMGWEPMPRKLLEVGCLYGRSGYTEPARQILTRVLRDYSHKLEGSDLAIAYIYLGDDAKAQEQMNQIITSDRSLTKKHQLMLEISQEYRDLVERAKKQEDEEGAKQCLQKEIMVLTHVTESNKSRHSAEAMYNTANAYYLLGDHQKAIAYFEKTVEEWSGYERRWLALSTLAVLYEELQQSNQLSVEEAGLKIKKVYQEIMERYPTSPSAPAAEAWLAEN